MSYHRAHRALGAVDQGAAARAASKQTALDEAHARARAEADIQHEAQRVAVEFMNSPVGKASTVGVALVGLAAIIWYLRKRK